MNRLALLSLGLFLAAAPAAVAAPNGPMIVFDSPSKDFGKVTEGQVLKHIFKFTNKGTATLEILNAEST